MVVLGATGFVGRHAGAAFQAAGHEVLAVARQPVKTSAAWRFFPMDLVNGGPGDLARMIDTEQPVAVVNAAGTAWSSSAEYMRQGNQLLVQRLLEALDGASWRPRLVHLGSMHEYTPQPVGTAVDERTPTDPATAYGQSKLLGTEAVLEASAAGRADAVVLRLANVIGAGTPPNSLLGQVARQLREAARSEGEALVRVAPLRASRDFVDARDTSEAVVAAALLPVGGQVINIGRGAVVHVRTMVDLLIAASGMAARVVENTGRTTRSPADPDWMRVDIGAARELLRWSPRRSLESSVRDLWRATEPR
ncbi:NAD(P)-dependent oxidoreductase [Peterkaempfera bronchialis]|uniref:NAD(P)-dependent oxidoreductase n=1 Tax=Peterkaempfera bronchialis TaxID=2126346 RepID=A0A345T6R5_9ACTN|nr:NAD(P)-dependent oxidoreductase [Peterkaempfera bronchialis]